MGRAPCCDKANVKRGPWSPEEDAILKNFVEKNGTGGNWIALPQKAGLRRCGKSCRLRWLNYLRPDIKHGGFSEEEDNIICRLYSSIGSRWSIIAAQLPGRTDNDIKNYWNTRLKKKLLGKGARDDQQTRRLLAKEAAAARERGMRYNSTSPTINGSEAHMSVSNTPSSSVSLTDPGKQQLIHSPYAIEAGNNVPMLLQDPTSSVSSESPLSNSTGFHVGSDHYEKGLKQISDYSSFTSILMRAIESNNKTESSTDIPPLVYPSDAQDALYAAPLCVNVKAETGETFDQNDSQLGFSMPHWGTCTSSGLWMNEINNGQDPSFSYGFTGDQMNELAYSNSSSSMQIKEEPNYGVTTTDTTAYWFSQLAAASASDPKLYSYILPSEGNSNSTAQGIFQEGIIY